MKIKKYFGFLLCLSALVAFGATKVNALPSSKDIVNNVSSELTSLPEGVKFYSRNDLTANNGQIDSVKRAQHDQAIVIPANSEAVELVVWSAGTNDRWQSATLSSTIDDFEDRNPGYTVIAAVNGDFFDINDTFQPSNSMVSAGDVWKKDTLRGGNVVGIRPDKSFVNGQMTANDYMSLKLLSGKVTTSEFKIDLLNSLPTDDQIALFYPNSVKNLNVSGYTVYKGTYDIYRVSKASSYVVTDPIGSFVRGTIVSVSNNQEVIPSVGEGEFYLVSKKPELAEKMVANTYVKCEYSLNGDWANVTNAIGTSATPLVKDGALVPQTDASVNPRTMMGVREDGSFVLMTVDGRQPTQGANGITFIEGGALLQEMECVQGWNLDGGGSTTSIIRNADGNLQVMNWPSDGGERALGNAILVVMRDPKIKVTNVGTRTITVEQNGEIANGTIQNVQVKLDGGDFIPLENKYTFTDLEKDSNYIVYYKYEILDEFGKTIHSQINKVNLHTLGAGVPEIGKFRISAKAATSVTFDYEILTDELTNVTYKYISYNGKKYDLDELSGKVTISGLAAGTQYDFSLVVEYEYNENAQSVTSEPLTYKPAASTGCAVGANVAAVYLTILSVGAAGLFLALRRRG